MDEPYLITYLVQELPDVRPLIDQLIEKGLTTTRDGRVDVCEKVDLMDESYNTESFEDMELSVAVNEIEQSHYGELSFWFCEDDIEIQLSFTESDELGLGGAEVSLSFQSLQVDPLWDKIGKEKAQERLDRIINLAGDLTEYLEPEYAWGVVVSGNMEHAEPIEPNDRPISEHVDEFSWITIMSEPVIEEFGGREHVLETPAERIEELDSGHILFLKAENPVTMGYPDGRRVDEHLLGN